MNEIRLWTREAADALPLPPACDEVAFLRLKRMLSMGAPLVLSDGETCLFVQHDPHDAAWLWTVNGIDDETLSGLLLSLSALREQGRLEAIVCKNRTARLLQIAFSDDIVKRKRLIAYRMPQLLPCMAEGACIVGSEVSSETAGVLMAQLVQADGDPLNAQQRRDMGSAFSTGTNAYAWQLSDGTVTTLARLAPVGTRYVDIHSVVTAENRRGKGYARALLSVLCQDILAQGRIPMLYADRDYPASNAAYRQIGFTEAGTLTELHFTR